MKSKEKLALDDYNAYKIFLDKLMHEIINIKSSSIESSNDFFYNAGVNLPFLLRNNTNNPTIKDRDYKVECKKLKEIYNALIEYVNEIKKTLPQEILTLDKHGLILSIDSFLNALLEHTSTQSIVFDQSIIGTVSIIEIVISHDCIEKTLEIITSDVFISGNYYEE